MKLRITIITVILVAAGIATFTWATGSSNCCFIVPGPAQITGNKTVVAANADGPGGTFVSPETETSVISCLNSSSNGGAPKPCSTQNQPNNVVTATGDGKNVGGNFILCDPTFAVTRFTQTIFEKTGTSFTVSGTSAFQTHSMLSRSVSAGSFRARQEGFLNHLRVPHPSSLI